MIFPVAVTLKRFLALEFVLTLGILHANYNYTLEAFLTGGHLGSLFRQYSAEAGRKDKAGTGNLKQLHPRNLLSGCKASAFSSCPKLRIKRFTGTFSGLTGAPP